MSSEKLTREQAVNHIRDYIRREHGSMMVFSEVLGMDCRYTHYCTILSKKPISRRVLEAAGLQYVGHYVLADGTFTDREGAAHAVRTHYQGLRKSGLSTMKEESKKLGYHPKWLSDFLSNYAGAIPPGLLDSIGATRLDYYSKA